MTVGCVNGAQCDTGWIWCWHPGGPCPEPNDPDCDICGPCLDCRSRGMQVLAPSDLERIPVPDNSRGDTDG